MNDPQDTEVERLESRILRLAREKSILQLVNNLMGNLGAMAGLDDTVDRIIHLVMDHLGGHNVAIYYLVESRIHYADAYGTKSVVESIEDAMVQRAMDTHDAVENNLDFDDTGMLTREFTQAAYCALPLEVGDTLIGVIKMEGMLLSAAEVRNELRPFFDYAALVLKNEIESHSRLRDAYDELSTTHMALREEMAERFSQQQFVTQMLDTIDSGIIACDADGVLTLFNRKASEIHGVPMPEEGLASFVQQHGPLSADGVSRLALQELPLTRALQGERVDNVELTVTTPGGQTRTVLASGRQIIDHNGQAIGAFVALNDVTDRQRLEVQLRHAQKLEAVGQLAAGIAHEINTPAQFVGDNLQFLGDSFESLQTLLGRYRDGVASLAGQPGQDAVARELTESEATLDIAFLQENIGAAFTDAFDGLERIRTIVAAMKEFAHPAKREKAPSDINRALQTTLTIARNEYKYVADIALELGELPTVQCYANDLNQVFLNLFINAAHAIADAVGDTGKRGSITVRTRREGANVRIEIADTGCGIPESIRDRVFEPFFTTKVVGRGSGQGLAIARSIVVELHKGLLSFETEVGKGTTFIIQLPIEDESAQGHAAIVEDEPRPAPRAAA